MEGILDPAVDNPVEPGGDILGNVQADGKQSQPDGKQPQAPALREWMKGLSETLQKSRGLSKFDTVESLAKSYTELESEFGRRVRIPSQDASSEEWAKYFDRVGRPKTADDYAIDRGRTDDALVRQFKAKAYEAGLTVDQAEKVFGVLRDATEGGQKLQAERYTARMKEADAMLRKEYGPQYDGKVADARKAYDILFDTQTKADIAESGLASNPRFIKVLAELGPQIKGDSFLQAAGKGGDARKDPLSWMDEKYGNRT